MDSLLKWGRDNVDCLVVCPGFVTVSGGLEVEEPVGEGGQGREDRQGDQRRPGWPQARPGEQEHRGGGAQHSRPQHQVDEGVEGEVDDDVVEAGGGVGHEQGEEAHRREPRPQHP